jgi:hypothetical protein
MNGAAQHKMQHMICSIIHAGQICPALYEGRYSAPGSFFTIFSQRYVGRLRSHDGRFSARRWNFYGFNQIKPAAPYPPKLNASPLICCFFGKKQHFNGRP